MGCCYIYLHNSTFSLHPPKPELIVGRYKVIVIETITFTFHFLHGVLKFQAKQHTVPNAKKYSLVE